MLSEIPLVAASCRCGPICVDMESKNLNLPLCSDGPDDCPFVFQVIQHALQDFTFWIRLCAAVLQPTTKPHSGVIYWMLGGKLVLEML